MKTIEDIERLFERIEQEYAPRVAGKRIAYESDPPWTYSLREVLSEPALGEGSSTALISQWPQGAPGDRDGVIAIFHPAMTAVYKSAAEETARAFGKPVWLIKMRDARWVYMFLYDVQRGCADVDVCWSRRQRDKTIRCRSCEQHIDSDWEYKITPEGCWETISLS